MTYIITRILESIEIPFLTNISSLKILDWFLIILVVGIGSWFAYTIYRDYKNKKESYGYEENNAFITWRNGRSFRKRT